MTLSHRIGVVAAQGAETGPGGHVRRAGHRIMVADALDSSEFAVREMTDAQA